MNDEFGPVTYEEATLPPALDRPVIGDATRAQFARRYGNHITDRKILEARYGYLPIGSHVHELNWEAQHNAPMSIHRREGDW